MLKAMRERRIAHFGRIAPWFSARSEQERPAARSDAHFSVSRHVGHGRDHRRQTVVASEFQKDGADFPWTVWSILGAKPRLAIRQLTQPGEWGRAWQNLLVQKSLTRVFEEPTAPHRQRPFSVGTDRDVPLLAGPRNPWNRTIARPDRLGRVVGEMVATDATTVVRYCSTAPEFAPRRLST